MSGLGDIEGALRELVAEVRAIREALTAERPKPSRRATPKGTDAEWSEAFNLFWDEYPRRVARQAAYLAWLRIEQRGQEGFDAVMAGLDLWRERWKAEGTEDRYVPHAATWLNQRRYADADVR